MPASLQLLAWLVLHPSAWRAYSAQLAPDLRPDFALSELRQVHLQSERMRRLLRLVYGVWPLLTAVSAALVLLLLGKPPSVVALGAIFSASLGWIGGLIAGSTISVAAGLAVMVASIPIGVAVGAGGIFLGVDAALVMIGAGGVNGSALTAGISWGAIGFVSAAAATTAPPRAVTERSARLWRTLLRRLGAILLGLLMSILLLGLVQIGIMAGLATDGVRLAGGVFLNVFGAILLGLLFGAATLWRSRRLPRSILWGAALAVLAALLNEILSSLVGPTLLRSVAATPGGGIPYSLSGAVLAPRFALLFGVGFALIYMLGERIGGPWAGAISGSVGTSSAFALFAQGAVPGAPWQSSTLGLGAVLVGLSYPLWLPVLLYPLELVWNAFLLQVDKRRDAGSEPLIFNHSTFWNEHQWLPLPRLGNYLLLAIERDAATGHAALNTVRQRRQRRAVRIAQTELNARWMATCDDVGGMVQAAHWLPQSAVQRAARPLLQTFTQIGLEVEQALAAPGVQEQRQLLQGVEEQLDQLVEGMVRRNSRFNRRFRPIATHWRQLVWRHAQMLAVSMELRQPIASPYRVGVPLATGQPLFVGRTTLAAQLTKRLRQQPAPVLLYGARFMGKSSFLNNLGRLLPADILPLTVDLQSVVSAAEDHSAFYHSLVRSMINAARRQRQYALPPLSREALADDPVAAFDEWLDEIEVMLEDGLALLALDAPEALDDVVALGRLRAETTVEALWRLVESRPRFRLLLASSHFMHELGHWRTCVPQMQALHLGYLSERETRQLIEQPVPDFALRYEPDAERVVVALTRGHPTLTQLLCHTIVAVKNEGLPTQRLMVTQADVQYAASVVVEHGGFYFSEVERIIGERARAMLHHLARRGPEATLSRQELSQQIAFHLDETLTLLERHGLIEAADDSGAAYRFQVELMRRWFARAHAGAR
jgi:hypothetical protein